MSNQTNEFVVDLTALLDKQKSKTQINNDIKELEKSLRKLRLVATLAKGDTKSEVNQIIRGIEAQLRQVRLQAKMDSRQLNREIDAALRNVSAREIQVNFDEGRLNTQIRRALSQAREFAGRNPISVNIDLKREKLLNQLDTFLNKHTKINESTYWLGEAERLREVIGSVTNRDELRNATDQLQVFTSGVRATGYAAVSTTDRIRNMLGGVVKIGNYLGLATLAISKFRQSLNTLKENDSILTEISKTSEFTKNQLKELGDEAFAVASKYGQVSGNYLLAVQEMARSGYETLSKELGELSLLAQSAGDMTAEMANNYILATDAAYKYGGSVEKLNAALDGANYISNKNSANLTDIADATRVSASFAANAGVAIDELTAAESTMIAVTKRSGSEIGRAFRSILLNLQQVSGEFDGEVIDEEQLKKVEARCHSLGVELEYVKDGVATLRNPMEILKDLAEVYNSLPDNSAEKQGLIADIGSKYHSNSLSALLSRWDLYEKMLGEYSQGTGSALEEANKTADSWAGRLAQLQNSWDSFVNSMTNQEMVKGSVSFLDGTIQAFEKLTNTLGSIPVLLTTINAGMAGLNKNYGITGLYNKETHKIDVQGNFMGLNITAYKNQVKHYQEAASAMEEWNQKMIAGATNINAFNNATVQNNAHLKAYLQTTSVQAPASLEGYKNYLRSAGVATDTLRLKTMLLTSAFTFGLSFAIQFVISGIMKIANAGKEAAQSAKELGDAFNQTKSEIEDYKTKIEELHDTINDSGSSIEDVTNARKELMSIQDEMIEKYGSEKGAVLDITNAINGQADAFDRLLGKQWQETKNEFNKSDIWKDIANAFSGYEDNIDRMRSEYGNHTATLNITRSGLDESELKEYKKLLLSLEGVEIQGYEGGTQFAKLSGNATDVYNTILEIQKLSEGFDIGASLEKDLTEAANNAKEVADTYKNMFDQYVLNEKVFKDTGYIEIYKGLTEAYEQYQDAMLSGDEEKLKEKTDAYAKYLTESLGNVKDEDVSGFLEDMFPEMQEKVAEWKFQLNFEPNIENYGFQNRLQNALDKLGGKSMEGILGLNMQAASGKEKGGYFELTEIAHEYGMELTWLLTLLEQMGMVQTESYQQLVETFGQEKIENLKPEDLEIAYKIDNIGEMTFEEFQEEVKRMKESVETMPTFSSTLSQVESLSEGLDQLDKIYADVYNKEEFDWSSILNNEGFSKVFSGFTDEYENFIQTISNNTSDIEACQDAFDRLATAYINNSEAMKNLTPETKDATIAMLEQMGVMNAEEVVTSRLAAQEAYLAAQKENSTIESENLADATWQEIAAVLAEGNASETATSYLMQLALSKIDINNNPINSDNDVNAIIAIANAAGQSTEYVNALKTALTNLQNAQASVQNAKNSKFMGASKAFNISFAESMEDTAQNQVNKLLEELKEGIEDNQLDPADFYAKVNYVGGSATEDAIDKANKENSGSKSKEAEKEEKETKETFNWIETAISRVQRLITKLKNTVSSTYKSWSTRNNALGNELHTITEELSHQQRAYEKYMGLANSVGLDGYYQHLVQIGDINLSEITDETLKEQIKQYQEWYEKALDAADAVEGLEDSIAELAKVKFDNLTKQFEEQLNAIEKRVSIIDSKVNQIKEMGYMLNKAFYEEAADYTRRNLSMLQNEYSTLSFALKNAMDNGDIAEYSEEWHNMKSQINEVEQAIIEANTSLIEYNNTLRELEWEKFDLMQDHISGITEETEFLIDLLSNDDLFRDKGIFSIFGEATLGLHSLSYESYLRQAKDYAAELEKIEASIANDKNNTKLLERREELLKLQRENILSAQAEKQAIRDLYEDSFKAMLSHLQELIDKRKEALKAEKDLYDYQKNVAKQTKEIASYQKQLDAYAGDTSEETKATIQKLKVSLEETKQELKDTEYDKWISDQERLMDDLYNEYEILLNRRLDNIDGLMKEAISQTNANSRDILSTIIATSSEVGYTITDAMGTIWGMDGGVGKVLSDYSSTFVATMSNLQLSVDAIKNYVVQIDQNRLPENKLEGDAVNGWRNENGAWSYYENSQKLSNTWVKDKGKYYHLNENGTMDANQWIWNDSGTWSYVDGGGAAMTGWQYLHWNGRDAWFNFDENGIMKANEWINDYFVDAYGYMRSNEWIGHNGKYYWVGADGKWLDLPGWSLDERPKDGLPIYEYAKGSNYIPSDRIAWTQENGKGEAIYRKSDGALLTPLGKGDAVFTPEKTERLLKMLRGDSYIPEQNLGIKSADYGTIQNIQNIQNTQNSQPVTNITFGDITLPDVLDSKQFADRVEKVMRNAMCHNTQTRRCITEAITAPMLGKGTLTACRWN